MKDRSKIHAHAEQEHDLPYMRKDIWEEGEIRRIFAGDPNTGTSVEDSLEPEALDTDLGPLMGPTPNIHEKDYEAFEKSRVQVKSSLAWVKAEQKDGKDQTMLTANVIGDEEIENPKAESEEGEGTGTDTGNGEGAGTDTGNSEGNGTDGYDGTFDSAMGVGN